jgi:hypothetical protein
MKVVGALLAIVGIVALALGGIQHFRHIFPTTGLDPTLFLVGGGIVALLLGAVLARLGGDEPREWSG